MAGSTITGVVVPAGTWTQVLWYAGTISVTYRFTVRPRHFTPGVVHVDWQWFSAGIPFFWWGSFDDTADITLVASLYTKVQFWTPRDSFVSIRPV